MSVFKVSLPSQSQLVVDAERVFLAFVIVFVGIWVKTPHPFTEAAIWASCAGAGAAVAGLVKSTLTTLL